MISSSYECPPGARVALAQDNYTDPTAQVAPEPEFLSLPPKPANGRLFKEVIHCKGFGVEGETGPIFLWLEFLTV